MNIEHEQGQQNAIRNVNKRAIANLALPAILWYCRHHWLKAESMISFITGVTHQHFVVITWLPTITPAFGNNDNTKAATKM